MPVYKKKKKKKGKGIKSGLKGPKVSHYGMSKKHKKQYERNLEKASEY